MGEGTPSEQSSAGPPHGLEFLLAMTVGGKNNRGKRLIFT